ncbi:MAG TPA: hemolysin family protein [Candidatus Blautia intestinigallinarum]|mgnify:FL=1|nr:hemolysin family protein [Candidatus Blautia intestinigallinarum]
MDSAVPLQLVILILLILLSAFFSSAETALTTVNKLRVQTLIEQENKTAKTLSKVIEDSGKLLSTILIGNNIVNMSASSLTTVMVTNLFGSTAVGIGTGVITLLILIFGEITPKTLAATHAEPIALAYARIIYGLMKIMTPIIFVVSNLANGVMFLLRIDPNAKNNTLTEHELRTIVNVSQENGVIENEEKQMIYNVFDFGDSVAKDVMVPRIDMTFVDVESTYEELIEIFKVHKHTRFPVYEDNTDNIIGIINVKDLILLSPGEDFSIRNILRSPYFTYEYKTTASLMVDMRKASVNLAIVLDEYGATAGLITLENLLEEIVGEIRDEYDEDEEEDIKEILPGKEYQVLGSAKLNDINEQLNLKLDSEDYDSIGGYIIEQLDKLPVQGQSVTLPSGLRLVVEKTSKNRVELVHLYLPEPEELDEEEE